MKYGILLLLLTALFSNFSSAQISKAGKIGIGYSGNFTGQTNEIGVSIWISRHVTIEPQIGIRNINLEDESGTYWKPGIGILFRFNENDISPYLGFRVKWGILAAKDDYNMDETYSDVTGSLVFGGEYFFTEWFSAGAELKINYISTDEKYSPTYPADASIFETEQVMNFRIYLR
jgi:hypothetical protein